MSQPYPLLLRSFAVALSRIPETSVSHAPTSVVLPLQTSGSSHDASLRTQSGSKHAKMPSLLSVTRVVVVRLPIILCHTVLRYSLTDSDPPVYKLPIEILWLIIDLYPRLDHSYMRSIRAEPSAYNYRFEVLRNLICVSKCSRRTFYNTYWETFEMALTYPRRRAPDPDRLDLGMESARYVSRSNELHGLRKTFWSLPDIASRVRYDLPGLCGTFLIPTLIHNTICMFRTLTFRVDRDSDLMQLFVDCLLALRNLHTLEIAPTSLPFVTLFDNAFKTRPQYRCVRKLIAPSGAHPILHCLPNLEELVCTRGKKPHILLTKVFQAYSSRNAVASFKRLELVGSNWTDMVGKGKLRRS